MKEPPLPIFIIGMPRSGSKLIREILNNNKDIFFPKAESVFIPYLVKKYGINPNFNLQLNRKNLISDLSNSTYLSNLKITRSQLENKVFLQILNTNSWSVIFRYLLNSLPNKKKENLFFGDKTPGYIHHLTLLKMIYPYAKFIHIIRDPRDQALSSRRLWNKNLYRNAQSWRDSIMNVRSVANSNDIKYIEIKYEELIKFPDLILRTVCDFLGCSFHQSMLDIKEPIEDIGVHSQKISISKDNSNKFYNQLTKIEIKTAISPFSHFEQQLFLSFVPFGTIGDFPGTIAV